MRETTQRSDIFISQISISRGIILHTRDSAFSNSVDFFVHFSSMVITHLTSSRNRESDSSRMPRTHTTHFSITSVGFLLQMFNSPSFNDTLESFTFGDTKDINHFVLIEDRVDFNFFFEIVIGKVHFLSSRSTVNLDFEDVVFLLSELRKASSHLGRTDSSHDSAVFSDSVQRYFDGFFFFFIFFRIFRESFLFGVHPVFIESSLGIFI